MNNTGQLVSNLTALTEKKIQLFSQIREVTLKQKEDIEKNDADNIQALVDEKQKLIDAVDTLDHAFGSQFFLLKNVLKVDRLEDVDVEKFPQFKDLKAKVQQIYTLARDIMKIEEENRENMDKIFNTIKAEMKKMSTGKQSLKAYEAFVPVTDGIYIDKKK